MMKFFLEKLKINKQLANNHHDVWIAESIWQGSAKTDIQQRFAEPEASRLCQQVDDAAILADLLEYMAKEMRNQ